MFFGAFNCGSFDDKRDAATAYRASLDEEQKKPAPKKYEFERDVSYTLNGEEFNPQGVQEYIDGRVKERDAINARLKTARNELRAFKRKYKEA